MNKKYVSLTALSCLTGMLHANASDWDYASLFTWESKYVENGRNELEDGGIFTAEFVAEHEGVFFSAWSVLGDSMNYKELQLTAGYGFEWQGFDLAAGWTHLEFDPDEGDDDEIFIEAGRALPYGLYLSAAGVYSLEAEGSFVELALTYPCSYLDNRLLVEPYLMQGIDFGYRTEAYDGWSNFQVGLDLSYALNDRFSLTAFLAHSFAQEDVENEGLGDVSWGGVGLSATF